MRSCRRFRKQLRIFFGFDDTHIGLLFWILWLLGSDDTTSLSEDVLYINIKILWCTIKASEWRFNS